MQRTLGVTAILVLSLVAAACGSAPTTPTPVTNSISSVTDMTPAPGTHLLRGQTVTFTGTAAYSLATADSGEVHLVIQDGFNQRLQSSQPATTVTKGNGEVTLSQSITLPDTGISSVIVFFALFPAGATHTSTVVSMSYPVQ